MILKVCGMKDAENTHRAEALGIDMIGNIFYPGSPRYVSERELHFTPKRAKLVSVFVNPSEEQVCRIVSIVGSDYVQLHGTESPEFCSSLRDKGIRIIKAFPIATAEDLQKTEAYAGLCDYYLFDTKTSAYGGSGKQFDWEIVKSYTGETPFLLSGGIGPDSIPALKEFKHLMLAGYDLNSRFEIHPGIKDIPLLKEFIQQIK